MEKLLIKKFLKIFEKLYHQYQKELINKKVGVFVSGGIDSSIIGYFTNKYFKNVSFFTLHSPKATDLDYVKILTNFLNKKLLIIEFNKKDVLEIEKTVIEILKNKSLLINPTQIALACAFYLLCRKAKNSKIKIIFTGQGPDVLLAGYHLYKNIPLNQLNNKIRNDLSLIEIDKKRDQAIADFFEINLINPYLEKKFIDFALKIPPDFKINQIGNEVFEKYLLRKLGLKINLPKEIIFRHKKALQYSTKIRKMVDIKNL